VRTPEGTEDVERRAPPRTSIDGTSTADPPVEHGIVLRTRGVTRDYPYGDRAVRALRGVDLAIRAGEFVAIVGPSGCGKSTLLNLLAGIDDPSAGSVELLGRTIALLRESARSAMRLREVGFVFQRFHLLSVLTAAENVELPMAEAGVSRSERAVRARDLLAYVGLGDRAGHRPTQLSGGEQQRVAIARALANRPAILLADEPTGELDGRTGEEVIRLFERLNREQGTTVVAVTHDPSVAARAHRTIEMKDGRVVHGD
jgi:ABC-type lipoprotein export system ATPase subunit